MTEPTTVTAQLLRTVKLPDPKGDKEQRGRVLVIGGSTEVPGAALLAGTAALRAGAGKLQIATCRSIAFHLAVAVPEARVVGLAETAEGGIDPGAVEALASRAAKCASVLIGPGMMDEAAAVELTRGILGRTEGLPFVLDGPAMSALLGRPDLSERHSGCIILTPHAGEMAHLLQIAKDEVDRDPLAVARRAASMLQATVIMKGSCSQIVTPEGRAWACGHGNIGLATSGSGDTLAGFIAGFQARGASTSQAAIWGVYVHGEAGERLARKQGLLGYLARELPPEVPGILADLGGGSAG